MRVTKYCMPLLKSGQGKVFELLKRCLYFRVFYCKDTNILPIHNKLHYYRLGRIINVSSVAGLYGYPGLSVYSATKHALEGYSAALRQECAKFNVNVVTVQPGDFSKATHLLDNHHR